MPKIGFAGIACSTFNVFIFRFDLATTMRVSNALRFAVSSSRAGATWGHLARPFYVNGLVIQELTHTQAKPFPNAHLRVWNMAGRFRKEVIPWILAGLPYAYFYYDMEKQDYRESWYLF